MDMPGISATAIRDSKDGQVVGGVRGFTLVELLIVLVIVAFLSTLGIINLAGRDQEMVLSQEARRLARVMTMASDWAVRNNNQLGLVARSDQYYFLVFDSDVQAWRRLVLKPFGVRILSGGIIAYIHVETLDIERRGPQQPALLSTKELPDLLLLSSGEYTPFRIDLALRGRAPDLRVSGDGFRRIQVLNLHGADAA